jgi:hypothetical protein
MLLALVPSGRFIGSLTAVPASERSTGVSGFVNRVPPQGDMRRIPQA